MTARLAETVAKRAWRLIASKGPIDVSVACGAGVLESTLLWSTLPGICVFETASSVAPVRGELLSHEAHVVPSHSVAAPISSLNFATNVVGTSSSTCAEGLKLL
eukprot:CAMPEP_0117504314 /NCGR_PEP_ID=MMETSP0784-20121206/24787_1 /TAXON_ID=39447 /ORGANISM="" /LENGTH=103 /DNA_ID=CAMNT_0005299669 /DNA_START=1016 /DNA_END=1327 /DNA_ORIENTATION=-